MNAEAYLRAQGWRGSGHSLDNHDRGIKKPLLIAHKQDQLGLGKRKAAYTTDDQWWMRAFDESLKNIGTGQESTLSQIREKGINRGGLYGFFVKGEAIAGTIGSDGSTISSRVSTPATPMSGNEITAAATSTKKTKRKREANGDSDAAKKAKKVQKKIAKLGAGEKAQLEKRASEKNQTLEEYVMRRIQKKDKKRTTRK
ncbi:hypothetical protein P153DRAFT_43188 [Dothidotthia symphoricarpi CBS 119687]|uniref:G-patch domain-containing protein n=1 Tax=Dothidotthia symphoricarpi CBS 119687 TaxID=1392245 RepID=A0A6A6A9L6_9PLEO|nr:uncharacterized protein P153DRAFT_43188 [Dothidotthia symphoricarpi CBS 119687]KAF2127865.1 hypothetical protein P153DRAFT_43188 [Dothidotthia symphoricarpi CBS 119687]